MSNQESEASSMAAIARVNTGVLVRDTAHIISREFIVRG
jgi:hypothetical protein